MRNVLVIDYSHDSSTRTLMRYLQQEGYTVAIAESDEEAQNKIDSSEPALILVNILLASGKSGFEICRELKSNPQTSSLPVVVYSERIGENFREGMLGEDAYLSSPIDKDELMEILKRLLK